MGKKQAGFYGHIVKADCECHPNMYFIEAYRLDPKSQKAILIGRLPCGTEEIAKRDIFEFVKYCATKFASGLGLVPDHDCQIRRFDGEEADRAADSFMRNNNPELH